MFFSLSAKVVSPAKTRKEKKKKDEKRGKEKIGRRADAFPHPVLSSFAVCGVLRKTPPPKRKAHVYVRSQSNANNAEEGIAFLRGGRILAAEPRGISRSDHRHFGAFRFCRSNDGTDERFDSTERLEDRVPLDKIRYSFASPTNDANKEN